PAIFWGWGNILRHFRSKAGPLFWTLDVSITLGGLKPEKSTGPNRNRKSATDVKGKGKAKDQDSGLLPGESPAPEPKPERTKETEGADHERAKRDEQCGSCDYESHRSFAKQTS
ncbi:hypothetical protein FRB97_004540, partial [Tulasnella sp. 331]